MGRTEAMNPFKLLAVTAGSVLLCLNCSVQHLAGGGTGEETTNGFVATILYQDGTPAANASVKVRPSTYLMDTAAVAAVHSSSIIDTTTDSLGQFAIANVDSGDYVIEVLDKTQSEGMVFRGSAAKGRLTDWGITFLNPVGTIAGTVNFGQAPQGTVVYVQAYGLDRVERINPESGNFILKNIAAGNYSLHVFPSSTTYLPLTVDNVPVASGRTTTMDTVNLTPVSAWNNSQKVFLNTATSGAGVPENMYNFPVLLRLTKLNFDFLSARTNGSDVRFIKADNTALPYQIERWDAVNGFAEIWVGVDTVFGNNNTQYFTMLWGNSDAVDASNSGAVFDTGVGFQGVWHMGDTDGVSCVDATNNHYDGTLYAMSSASSVTGAIGAARMFDGATNYIIMSNTASSKLNFLQNGTYSVSAWVYTEVLDLNYHSIISKSNQQYGLQLGNQNTWVFFEFENKQGWETTEAPATVKTWQYLVAVRSGAKQYIYVNGALADSTITMTSDGSDRYTSENVCIGKRAGETNRWWDGMIDEVRIYSCPNSANWIKLCYMNQKATDALVTFK
jgi:Concanavalin A-like lectin/glucanases superfamily/Domain of unknown function (DUF2341)